MQELMNFIVVKTILYFLSLAKTRVPLRCGLYLFYFRVSPEGY